MRKICVIANNILPLQRIENVVLKEKAEKIVVDGAVYVIRNNRMYNISGARVR